MLSWLLLPSVAAAATSWETLNCKDLFSYYSVQTYGGGSPLHVNLRGFSPRNHKVRYNLLSHCYERCENVDFNVFPCYLDRRYRR